ncbi:hypothetical protein ACFOD0_14870 [Shewanella intestini]|uniref:ATP-binding protein n=1 Tax=Shewanella intestini TaxID=2017544 RepID=A0ABS5I6D7_9GAMM|nr:MULTISPECIES: hypothetical protein [Shewanella]MBR9729592.1 hypothetical protein [Shewanella intestini]MRG37546.1 hypothetical protein [Shewanella sp. XMDDZSB0408]
MQKKLEKYISEFPGQKARVIAKKLGLERAKVSRFLHESDLFIQEDCAWHLIESKTLELDLPDKWITATSFERFLSGSECLFGCNAVNIVISFQEKSSIKLDAGIRLLFLINMLARSGKNVTLNFSRCQQAKGYLNRAGFFDALDEKIIVLPARPKSSTAKVYRGGSNKLVEFAEIHANLKKYDNAIPDVLTNTFIKHSSEEYEVPAYNLFSELCENIVEHSNSPIPGVVAMQVYSNAARPHIQIVISDAGDGLCNTLRPALKKNNTLGKKFDIDKMSDGELLAIAYTRGGLSRKNITSDDCGGLGLFTSGLGIKRYGANLMIRLDTCQVELKFENNRFVIHKEHSNLPKLPGTHIYFQFFIDKTE